MRTKSKYKINTHKCNSFIQFINKTKHTCKNYKKIMKIFKIKTINLKILLKKQNYHYKIQ